MSFAEIAALTMHDVKNSLAQLAGQAEARGDVTTLRTLIDASEKLTRLLVFYKSETSILQPVMDARSPLDLIEELGQGIRALGSITISVFGGAAPSLWFYDETLVRMVLSNALHNALRYARSQITLSAIEVDEYLEFSVHDDGVGYPESVLADVGATAPITAEGTGLGLRLAMQVAQLHANFGHYGSIRLANEHGALFILRLPK
jgi:signal transduction histidine kinase